MGVGEVGRDGCRGLAGPSEEMRLFLLESNGLNPSFSTHCLEVPILSLTGNLRQGRSTPDI